MDESVEIQRLYTSSTSVFMEMGYYRTLPDFVSGFIASNTTNLGLKELASDGGIPKPNAHSTMNAIMDTS